MIRIINAGVVHNGIDMADEISRAGNLPHKVHHAMQVDPWREEGRGLWLVPSDGLASTSELVDDCHTGFCLMLKTYLAKHGHFPPFAYIDTDRFWPWPGFWKWAKEAKPTPTLPFIRESKSDEWHAEAATLWFQAVILGMKQAVHDLGANTKIGCWGLVNARDVLRDGYMEQRMPYLSRILPMLDFVSPHLYVEPWTERLTLDELSKRLAIASAFACDFAPALPVYSCLRLNTAPDMANKPVDIDLFERLLRRVYSFGDGLMLWEAVPVKDGSIGKRMELVTEIMGEGGGE